MSSCQLQDLRQELNRAEYSKSGINMGLLFVVWYLFSSTRVDCDDQLKELVTILINNELLVPWSIVQLVKAVIVGAAAILPFVSVPVISYSELGF